MSPGVQATIDEVLADPALIDEWSDRSIVTLRARAPMYRLVPAESLSVGNRRALVIGLAHLREGRLPSSAELRQINAIGEQRAREGVDLASVLLAYQVAGEIIHELLVRRARRRGVTEAELVAMTTFIWKWLSRVTTSAATAHREVELHLARADERRVGDLLHTLLMRPISQTEAQNVLLELGLDPMLRYVACRGRLAPGATVGALATTLREVDAAGSGREVAVAVYEHDVVALIEPEAPYEKAFPANLGTFGIGSVEPADRLEVSYVAATRALNAAMRLGRPGGNDLRELRLAAIAATDPDMTRILRDRLLTPVLDKGAYGEDVWRSVVCYLDSGQRVDAAAEKLHIHANTLRHRLTQFGELTGADPRSAADVAEIWWLATVLAVEQESGVDRSP